MRRDLHPLYQTNFANASVYNIRAILLKLIGINRKRANITVFYQHFANFTGFSIIEEAIGINTFVTIFEPGVTKNISRIVVLVIPNQRDFDPIISLKCVPTNYSSIRASKIISGSPAAEITILDRRRSTHFDFPPCFWFLISCCPFHPFYRVC